MHTGKRTKVLAAASAFALVSGFAVPASAQTNAELQQMIRDLNARVQQLEGQLNNNVDTAQEAAVKAEAAANAAVKAEAAADKAVEAAEVAQKAGSGDDGNAIKMKWGPSPTFKSADGRFEMHVRGRVQADLGFVNDDLDDGQDRFATEFRRARLGVEGIAWKDIKYKFEIDFADNEVDITDAYLQYKGVKGWKFTFGQFKERVSLDEQTSSRQIAVMERAAITDAFGFQRRIGIGIDFNQGDFFVNSGIYGGSDISENEDSEGFVFAVRTFWEPEIGNGGRAHIGASLRHRDLDNDIDGTDVRYRQRPFAHVSGTRYVSTGSLPDIKSDLWYGFEAAGTFGSFWSSAEYGMIKANVLSGSEAMFNGEGSVSADGGYIDFGWFLTGETRPLKGGEWKRPKVNNPVFEGGAGAWALVTRFDYLNLNDTSALVYGGKQWSIIVGLSWYLNRHTRIMFNYARTEVEKGSDPMQLFGDAEVDPTTGEASIDAVTARFQVDW